MHLFYQPLLCLFCLLMIAPLCAEDNGAHKEKGMNEGETVDNAAVKGNKAMDAITDVAGLPRVLLMGDSISIGYTVATRQALKGEANVHRVLRNCGSSNTGFTGTRPGPKSWLGDGNWDVIHFNHGIWDTKLNPKTGLTMTSHEDYIKNLQGMIDELKKTGATVIFATTTPIPDVLLTEVTGQPKKEKRLFEDIITKNKLATELMKKNNVLINDLYAHIYPKRAEYWLKNGKDLHFTKEGSAYLAEAVANSIRSALKQRK